MYSAPPMICGLTASLLVVLVGVALDLSWGAFWRWRLGQNNALGEGGRFVGSTGREGQRKLLEVFCCRAGDGTSFYFLIQYISIVII